MPSPDQSPDKPAAPAKKKRKKRGMMDVITGQKQLIYSIIAYLCSLPFFVVAFAFSGPTNATTLFSVVLAIGLLILLASGILAAVSILKMGVVLFEPSRYLYALGTLIPIIGLIVMITANANANRYLKERGVTVGFFGAKR